MDKPQYETFVDKIDKITRLLAVQTVKGLEREQDKIELLVAIGFRPAEIDKLLNKSSGYASAALSNLKKKQLKSVQASQTDSSTAESPVSLSGGNQ